MPRAGVALRVLGLVLLVGFVLSRVDVDAVRASWRGMSPGAVALAAAGFCAAMAVRVVKWRRQAEAVGLAFAPGQAAPRFLLGVLLGVVTPMRLGELTRLSALSFAPERREATLALAASALLLEKVVEVVVLGSLAMLGAWVLLPGTPAGPLALAGVAGLGTVALGTVTLPEALLARLPAGLRTRVVAPLLAARDGLPLARRLELLALTGVAQGANMLAGLQVYRAFGDLDLLTFVYGMPLLTFSSAAPVTISGIGLREAAAMQVFGGAGYPASGAAVAASVVFLGANVLSCLVLLPLTWRNARRHAVVTGTAVADRAPVE
jgi:uncharacterized membrane protein YbhN (UPF0104 family)